MLGALCVRPTTALSILGEESALSTGASTGAWAHTATNERILSHGVPQRFPKRAHLADDELAA